MGFPLLALKTITAYVRAVQNKTVTFTMTLACLSAIAEVAAWLKEVWTQVQPMEAIEGDPVTVLEARIAEVEANPTAVRGPWLSLILKVLAMVLPLLEQQSK